MERIKISKYFYADELIDPRTYFNEVNNGIDLLDYNLLKCLDLLREKSGKPLYINTWWSTYDKYKDKKELDKIITEIENSKTLRKYSGFRGKFCKIGAKFSAHRKGKGADPKGLSPKILFNIIKENSNEFYNLGLRRLEDTSITPTWLHLDTWDKNDVVGIEVVDMKKVVETLPLK